MHVRVLRHEALGRRVLAQQRIARDGETAPGPGVERRFGSAAEGVRGVGDERAAEELGCAGQELVMLQMNQCVREEERAERVNMKGLD